MQTKVEFRKEQRQRLIDQADTWQKEKEELALYLKLFATKKWQEAQVVALTLSQPEELDTKPIITAAFQAGKQVEGVALDPALLWLWCWRGLQL